MAISKPNGSKPEDQKLTRFHVSATGHSLNYLPEYIATRHGFFKEQGLEVTVSVPRPWDLVLDELADGTAAAALGGIWVPSMYRDRVREYTTFAQLSNRCPLALIVRKPVVDGFKLSDVAGKTVLMKSGNGASVGLFFKMLLRENGVDPKSVDYVQDLDGAMLANLFQGGMGDYFFIDNVSARIMAKRNPDISVVMEMATDGEDIPWSVYYRETATITPAVIDTQERFCAALKRGMEWVMQHDAESFRDELAEIFPAVPVDVLVDLTNIYRRDSMWTSPLVSRHGFDRWQLGIADGRLVTEPLVYETIVDSGPAMAVKK
ncbi:periplasmic binding protein-like II [Hypoxylon rubiginosum]|uniref:Periplasmic binding protein-like II n=1 Tax=Hypoxylon rubiginosum TaxID=110542 RepID=A0ACB9Z1P2_9PEZI|nr:periplasmic binding protein-like II [Hypoxylon rubiginosum]